MGKQKVYSEFPFIRNFVNSYPKTNVPGEDSIQELKLWSDINAYIFRANIHLDISVSEFGMFVQQEEYYKFWWKKSCDGECNIEFNNNNFPDIERLTDENDLCSSVYLTTKSDEICKKAEDSFGVIILNSSHTKSTNKIFQVYLESVKKGNHSHQDWRFLAKLKHPCNSLAIVDNYILKNETVIRENLIPILDQLLPSSLEIDFHLSVFSMNEFNNDRYFRLVQSELQRLRPNLTCKITLHQIRNSEFHDRCLMTNYLLCDSGSGFDLFVNRKAIHQTIVLGLFPFSANNMNPDQTVTYEDLKLALKKMKNNAAQNPNFRNYWGDNVNRLLN